MLSTRRILAITAICALPLVAGCSSDDDGAEGDTSTASGSASTSPSPYDAPCDATVEITGKVEASWEGGADVMTATGRSTYSSADGEANVLAQSGSKKTPGTVTVAISGDVLTGKPDSGGVDVDPQGGGAEIDTDVTGKIDNKPTTLHVVATFVCDGS